MQAPTVVDSTGEVGINTFGGGSAETSLGAGVLVLLFLIIILVWALPRRFVLAPLLFGLFLLPVGQALVMGGLHIYVARIIVLTGLIRAATSVESGKTSLGSGFTVLDKLFIVWVILRGAAFVLRLGEMGAVVNQLGLAWDIFGGYFLIRMLITNSDDVLRTAKALALIAVVLSVSMIPEKLNGFNVYGLLCGTPIIPGVRNGSIRAQGPFHHAILAGVFGATLVPLFVWLWKSGKARVFGISGILASTIITATASSSTPVSAYVGGIAGLCLWPLRKNLRIIRWAIVIGLLVLNFAMTAPVWWALEHVDFAGGSAGEHRAELVDNFFRHFGDWWLIGTSDNASWGYEMWDLSDQYVAEGEQGGLAVFICFVGMLYVAYRWVGLSRKATQGDRQNEWFFWLLGAALFAHTVAYFGISYFDQTRFSWFILLAMITVATAPFTRSKGVRTSEVRPNGRKPQAETRWGEPLPSSH